MYVPWRYTLWSEANGGDRTEGGCLYVGGEGGNVFELNECDLYLQIPPPRR